MKKIATYGICSILFFLVFFFSGCKKEDFSKKFAGSYTGTAVWENEFGSGQTTTYTGCKLAIEEDNEGTYIKLTFTLLPGVPSYTGVYMEKVHKKASFSNTKSNGGTRITSSNGVLQGNQFDYRIEQSGWGNEDYIFTFTGQRD
ncbi:MAG: hypothetical protein ABIR18_14490 [Chitinophagaceae bacterium]